MNRPGTFWITHFRAVLLGTLLFLSVWPDPARCRPQHPEGPYFRDIAASSGLEFVHFNGMSGEFYFPEMNGHGGALLDFDNDGDLDVYLVQGAILGPGKTIKDAQFPPKDPKPRDRLFKNELTRGSDGKLTARFVDVTDKAKIESLGYGMGVAAGDFNNDGWVDIYVTNVGPNQMFFNNKDGTFTDVTQRAGVGDDLWGMSAAVFDFDKDGWLDIYLTNYVEFDLVKNPRCYAPNSRRDYCGPSAFTPSPDKLYRNRGDGTFEDATRKLLTNYVPGSGMGVVAMDADGDGWQDIYVANDGRSNQLWMNREGKSFEDDALFAGVAVNQDGEPEASMGVAMGDIDADGDEDILITHIMGETNTLYINDGTGLFEDRTISFGLAASSFPHTTFGTGWIDFDNDGWLDLYGVSGAVLVIEERVAQGDPYPLDMPNQLFRNLAGKKFEEVSRLAGEDATRPEVGRGAVMGDIDNDGDMDILITNNNGPTQLLENLVGNKKNWLGLRLIDPDSRRDLLGTVVVLKRDGTADLWRRARTDGSYCSSKDPRLLFGLGDKPEVKLVEIYWPDGSVETWKNPVPNRYTTLVKGSVGKEKNR